MDEKLHIGVIGVGQIGQVHLDTYKTIPDVEVVAIADTNREHAQSVSIHYDVPNVFADFRELLDRNDIQAIGHLEKLHGEESHRPHSRRAVVQFPRIFFGVIDQFLQIPPGSFRFAGDHRRVRNKGADGREILMLIGDLRVQLGGNRQGSVIRGQDGISVGFGLGHKVSP